MRGSVCNGLKSLLAVAALALLGVFTSSVNGQEAKPKQPFNFDFGGGNNAPPGEMEVSAKFFVQKGSLKGRLVVEAVISDEWHTYSTTQPQGSDGGPQVSTIKAKDSVDYRLTGPFVPDRDPQRVPSTAFVDQGKPLTEEHFEGKVVWTAPLELTEGVKPETLEISASYNGQICHATGGCIPKNPKFVARFAGYDEPVQTATEFSAAGGKIMLRGKIEPQTVAPGGKVKLTITAQVADKWHVYHQAPHIGTSTNKPTLIVVSQAAGWKVGETKASSAPEAPHDASADLPYHEGTVHWVTELELPANAQPGETTLVGYVGFQTCSGSNCLPPMGAKFSVTVNVGSPEVRVPATLNFTTASYADIGKLAETMNVAAIRGSQSAPTRGAKPLPLPILIGLSLAGGFLLNFMPCVLPVLGLKLISFAKQGGESRSRMVAINLAYTAGLLVVFMVLATLSITIGLAWGEQMTHFWFRMGILVVTFALALSLFGVWEIPMPGIAGSDGSNKLQQQEGLGGAFFKGLFTTILGISCSGPLLGFVLGATLALPPIYTVLIFGCIGLGMASPFLALPFVPGVRNILPKPGDWMDTFKQIMGFVMIAAAVFFFSTIEDAWKIAALTLLVGVSFACWWIGKVPIYEPFGKQLTAWIGGCAAAAMLGVAAFNFLGPPAPGAAIAWEEFSLERIAQLEAENKTVFVDFTADWCANCKTNLKIAVEREDVKKLLEKNNVVAMKAEWITENPGVEAELKRLGRSAIPVLAVYPAGNPNEVIVLDGLVLKFQVLNAIRQAGPSKVAEAAKVAVNKSQQAAR